MKKITLMVALFAAFSMNAQIFSDDFNGETLDAITYANWTSVDIDGDGNFWEVFDSADVGDGTSSLFTGLGADSDSWEGTAFMPDNYLITSNPIDLSASTGTTISYLVGSYQTNGSFIADKYSVYMTASSDPVDIAAATPITTRTVGDDATCDDPTGANSAASVTLDASAFDGQTVYLTFRHYDTIDENSVLIDDVVVDGTLGVTDLSFNNFSYYVSHNSELHIAADYEIDSVVLHNVLGQKVASHKFNDTNLSINLSDLSTGMYLATITIEGNSKTVKIVKK